MLKPTMDKIHDEFQYLQKHQKEMQERSIKALQSHRAKDIFEVSNQLNSVISNKQIPKNSVKFIAVT